MGEAKRRRRDDDHSGGATRSWATGEVEIIANGRACFSWSGSRQDAAELQKRYLDTVNKFGLLSPLSHAKRAAAYLMAFGMPKAGDKDLRPSNYGEPWDAQEVELYKAAVLWLALREHIPDRGEKIEDVFAGKSLRVMFDGDREMILDATQRELNGEGFDEGQFQMMVGVAAYHYPLDPREAVAIKTTDLWAMVGASWPPDKAEDRTYVPRFPVDQAEARAMMKMTTIFVDATDPDAMELARTDPGAAVMTYAGYTDDELRRGRPAVFVR